MKLSRRRVLRLAGAAVALPAVSRIASAQAYPSRPIRIVIGYTPAGSADITARLMGQWMSERLGQTVVIENRPGAGTNLATETVVRAPADGYTLLLVAPANAINATLFDKLNHNYLRDIAPVAGINRFANVMEVNPAVPVEDRPRVHRLCQGQSRQAQHGVVRRRLDDPYVGRAVQDDDRHPDDPRAVSWECAGADRHDLRAGAGDVRQHPDVDPAHPGGQAARIGGHRARRARSCCRIFRSLPTISLATRRAPGTGLGAPRGTPPDIIEKLNKTVNAILADPAVKAKFADMGATLIMSSPADFGKYVADETEKWGKVVKFARREAGLRRYLRFNTMSASSARPPCGNATNGLMSTDSMTSSRSAASRPRPMSALTTASPSRGALPR